MDLKQLLEQDADAIVGEATAVLERTRLQHYSQDGIVESGDRLRRLFDLLHQSIADRDLVPVMEYMRSVADERFHAGYEIREVQTAINVLEETIWKHVVDKVPPGELAESLGLVSTVLGAAKDSLAREYVLLATKKRAPSLNLSALFEGSHG
jgi:hypothetical protein